jgi:oligopeptide/dipeptide ABC transporter ATP-binding protein
VDISHRQRLVSIEGLPPVLYETPTSCPFAPRCRYRTERCLKENPPLMPVGGNPEHRAACWEDHRTGKARNDL